jgi:hypothetical protein
VVVMAVVTGVVIVTELVAEVVAEVVAAEKGIVAVAVTPVRSRCVDAVHVMSPWFHSHTLTVLMTVTIYRNMSYR